MFFCFVLRRSKRFLQWGDLCQPRPVDLFGDKVRFSLRAAFGGDFARIRLIGGFEQGEPVCALRVGRVFAVQTALRVGNADVQCRLKAFGTAEGIGFFQYVQNGLAFKLSDLVENNVPTANQFGKLGAMFRRTQPLIDFAHGFDTGEVVSVVARQDVGRCFGFAQVVQQGGIAFGQAQTHIGGALQRHQGMDAAVDFGMVVGALRHAEEGIDFGQQDFERAAFAQHFNHFARIFFHQTFRKLLPDAFGNQCVRFAVSTICRISFMVSSAISNL